MYYYPEDLSLSGDFGLLWFHYMVRWRLGVPFLHLSAGLAEWQCSFFVTILLHHAPSKMTTMLVLFIYGGLSVNWYLGRPIESSSCHFSDLFYSSPLYLLRHVHSQELGANYMAWKYSPSAIPFFGPREWPCSRRPQLNSAGFSHIGVRENEELTEKQKRQPEFRESIYQTAS